MEDIFAVSAEACGGVKVFSSVDFRYRVGMAEDNRSNVDRRRFLLGLASSAVGVVVSRYGFGQTAPSVVEGELIIDENSPSHLIPANFNGLSYELAQLSDPDFFAGSNKELIAYFRLLSPSGVLRLGGNSSESCWFVADAATTAPVLRAPGGALAENWMPHRQFAILPLAIDRLGEFLEASGWQLIYGLNLGNSSPERAAAEAEYVAKTIGDRLLFFQIGNEPSYYREANNRTAAGGLGIWGLSERVDGVCGGDQPAGSGWRFGGPDVEGNSPWVEQFAAGAAKNVGSRLVSLTTHYYAEGPPDDAKVTVARLLRGDAKVGRRAKVVADLAAGLGISCRMTEGNSCYRGGKPGMSDAFASALWAGDYMLTLAEAGYGGVNFHGGGAAYLRASLGGHMPGDLVGKNVASSKEASGGAYYTPIAGDLASGFHAQPIFYGMMLANQLAGARMVKCSLENGGVNVTAFAGQIKNGLRVAIFNESESRDLSLRIGIGVGYDKGVVWRLVGAGVDSTSAPVFAGARIDSSAKWSPGVVEMLQLTDRGWVVEIPRCSAAVVFLG